MHPTLDKIWLEEFRGEKALRADFTNDRHHRVAIQQPHGNEQLAQALMDLALNIRHDPHLTANTEAKGPAACGRSRLSAGLGNKRKEKDMASQLIGTTETGWFNPGVNPPPFDMKLLLMVAGSRSEDCGRTFEPYTAVITAYVQQQGPGDEYDDDPAFEEYMSGDQTDFLDFQFDLKDEDGEVLDWYSDSIVAWAYYPLGIAQTAVNVERKRQSALAPNSTAEQPARAGEQR